MLPFLPSPSQCDILTAECVLLSQEMQRYRLGLDITNCINKKQ